jgi:hypothetical protein
MFLEHSERQSYAWQESDADDYVGVLNPILNGNSMQML